MEHQELWQSSATLFTSLRVFAAIARLVVSVERPVQTYNPFAVTKSPGSWGKPRKMQESTHIQTHFWPQKYPCLYHWKKKNVLNIKNIWHTHTFVSVNCGDFLKTSITFILTKLNFLSPNPKPTPYKKTVCIVTLSDKHHLLFFRYFFRPVIFSTGRSPQMSKNVRFYYACGDIWSSQCSINKNTHTYMHIQCINIYNIQFC